MENLCLDFIQAFDFKSFLIRPGIAFRGQHHTHRNFILPLEALESLPAGYAAEHLVGVALQKRQNDLGLGVPETGVELDDLDALRGFHKAAVEHSAERAAFPYHCRGGLFEYAVHSLFPVLIRDERKAGVGSHSSGVRALVEIEGPFVVLGQGHRIDFFAADKAHKGELGALQVVFNHHSSFAELPVQKH